MSRAGFLDSSEILRLSEILGNKLSAAELSVAMASMDEDGSGEIDFREFYRFWSRNDKEEILAAQRTEEYYTIVPL